MSQTDLFPDQTSKLIGLRVKLDRPSDRDRTCCASICIIGPPSGPHAGSLKCEICNEHRGWISKSTAAWVENVIGKFGAPSTPIIVRKSHIQQETT